VPSDRGPRAFASWVFQDWRVNAPYLDSQLILAWFRLAQRATRRWGPAGRAVGVSYRLLTSMFMSIELPPQIEVGPRLRLFHPHSVVLNPQVRLGADCILRQNVTIGNVMRRDGTEKGVASAGDRVEFGAGCVVVGDVHVGDDARIGALALVLTDVPARGVVVGNPAKLVRIDDPDRIPRPPGA
jgi:putative colanic acid biosynthesis acetyltransferase WcaB